MSRARAGMGKNSELTKDVFGRQFVLPVDKEHKADICNCSTLCVTANPHMRAFHTSWFGFFSSFYSTFAAASLGAYIIPDLDLTEEEWGLSGVMAVMGTIAFRLAMGWICDKFGARKGLGYLLFGTMPAIVIMMFVQQAWQFILLRCVIGFSLATFVACQTWCAQMFAKKVVGIANATAAGWGNLGGGVTNLTMPYVFLLMMSFTGENESLSWRLSYIVPLILHFLGGCFVLTARDLPDGNFKELELSGAKQKTDSGVVLKVGCSNVNAWIFTATYGMCFGVELTMNNVAAKYFYTYHGLTPLLAGICASMWGMMNLFARSIGGWISDWANKKFGMRGRLWACWIVQTLEGVLCILMGSVTLGLDAPHADSVGTRKVDAWVNMGNDPLRGAIDGMPNGWVNLRNQSAACGMSEGRMLGEAIVESGGDEDALSILACNTLNWKLTEPWRACLQLGDEVKAVLRQTAPPAEGGPADLECISNADQLATVMIVIIFFSGCVQAAEGLHYGIVPYISRSALGVVSGMIGAGGNAGAVIVGNIFFTGNFRTDQGIINMGWFIIGVTALIPFMYFGGNTSDSGGMFFKAGGLGKYDPQIIKPPAGYRGADVMDYAAAAAKLAEMKSGKVPEVASTDAAPQKV